MKLMHGYMDRGHGHGTHAVCDEEGNPLEMDAANVAEIVSRWNYFEINTSNKDLLDRMRLLTDIALSALAMKLNVEYGFNPPPLHAIKRDLNAFQRRFGGLIK